MRRARCVLRTSSKRPRTDVVRGRFHVSDCISPPMATRRTSTSPASLSAGPAHRGPEVAVSLFWPISSFCRAQFMRVRRAFAAVLAKNRKVRFSSHRSLFFLDVNRTRRPKQPLSAPDNARFRRKFPVPAARPVRSSLYRQPIFLQACELVIFRALLDQLRDMAPQEVP